MTTSKRLTPDDLTPEWFAAFARERGLRLLPGRYLTFDEVDRKRLVGCCAAGAVAIAADPGVVKGNSVTVAIQSAGLPADFRCGLVAGFDGKPSSPAYSDPEDYARGYAVGLATRKAAGLEANP